MAASGGTTTGRLWSELLHCLTDICNSCDRNGTIPSELPIVEQIPVLHRLDHSVHTMRLWAVAASKALCTDWNVSAFFRVAHSDINKCLEQLRQLRVPEMVPSDAAEVLVEVCVALRAKLVSEIKVNVAKLTVSVAQTQLCDWWVNLIARVCSTANLRRVHRGAVHHLSDHQSGHAQSVLSGERRVADHGAANGGQRLRAVLFQCVV